MDNSRLKELFEMVKKKLIKGDVNKQYGICGIISELSYEKTITANEKEIIKRYLYRNKPTIKNKYKEFIQNEYWINDAYWWKPIWLRPEKKQIRINYLTKLIDNIK